MRTYTDIFCALEGCVLRLGNLVCLSLLFREYGLLVPSLSVIEPSAILRLQMLLSVHSIRNPSALHRLVAGVV